MKIIRDGVEIELTSSELYDAWWEQQALYDKESILARIGEEQELIFRNDGVLERFLEEALYRYNKNRDYGCDESWSFDDAVDETLSAFDNEATIS